MVGLAPHPAPPLPRLAPQDSYLPAFANCDADDLLSQIRTWRHADVSRHTGGDLAAALGRVRARVLLMPCTTDKYFTVDEVRGAASTRAAVAIKCRLS